jgi:hypothetical protein
MSKNKTKNKTKNKPLIIGMYLHGELNLDEKGHVIQEKIPENMNIKIINCVSPGVPFISTLENYESIISGVTNTINKQNKLKSEDCALKSEDCALKLRNLLVQMNKNQFMEILKEHQKLYKKNEINENIQLYIQQYDNAFRLNSYKSGEYINNKLYTKFNDNDSSNFFFNKIIFHNLDWFQDLFEILKENGLDVEEITLGQILDFLANLNLDIQNIIIVDLSCSVFKGDEEFLTKRNIRRLRRELLNIK